MPKSKPETRKCWSSRLKSKSPAKVADIFTVSKWQVERIFKRYQETGDVHDRPSSDRQDNCSRRQLAGPTVKNPAHVNRLTAPGGVDTSDACFVKNCMSDSCLQWSPQSYCCPETSAKQETAKKPCCVRQGPQPDGKFDSRKVVKNVFFWWIVSWAPSQAPPILSMTLRSPSEPTVHPEEVERLWFGVTANTEVPGRSVRWMVTLIVPNINRFLPSSTFPTTRGVRFFNRMQLLVIPQVPLWSFSGGRRSRSFRDGQHSLQIWILLSISREECRRKLEGPSRRTWRSFGMPARWPSMPSPTTSWTSSTTLCQTRRLHQQALRLSAKPNDFINKLYDSLPNSTTSSTSSTTLCQTGWQA